MTLCLTDVYILFTHFACYAMRSVMSQINEYDDDDDDDDNDDDRTVQKALRYIEPFRRGSRVWQTNRQTNGRTDRQTKTIACADKLISIKSRA